MRMEFFMPMLPPTATHQEKQVRVVKGKPVLYDPPEVADARAKLTAHLAGHRPERPLEGPARRRRVPRLQARRGQSPEAAPGLHDGGGVLAGRRPGGQPDGGEVLGGNPRALCPRGGAGMRRREAVFGRAMSSEFPARLRMLRERKRMTRKALGECCGLSKAAISKYERGEREPSASSLEKIADFFDVTTDSLLGREKNF